MWDLAWPRYRLIEIDNKTNLIIIHGEKLLVATITYSLSKKKNYYVLKQIDKYLTIITWDFSHLTVMILLFYHIVRVLDNNCNINIQQ